MFYKENKYLGDVSPVNVVLKGLLIAFMITIPTFFVVSVFLAFTNMPEKYIGISVAIITFISIPLGAFISTRGAKGGSGTLSGAAMGALYIIIVYVITGIFIKDFSIDMSILRMLLISIITGAIGGLVGINMKKKRKYPTRRII